MKANSLADIIVIFNPQKPLIGDELTEFYVNRPGNPLERMKRYLLGIGLRDEPVKLLFSGHRGSGKSTELNKLSETVQRQFFIVPVQLPRIVNIATLSYQDILMGMAFAIYRRAGESEAIARSPAKAIQDAWQEAVTFLHEKIYGPAFPLQAPLSPGEITIKASAWIIDLEAKYGLSQTARERLIEYVDSHLDELHRQIDLLSTIIRSELKRPVLFIIEGIDKTDLQRAADIFCNHAYALTAFRCATIYTFPIDLAYSGDFNQAKISFSRHFALPNLKLRNHDGTADDEGLAHLREVVQRRIAPEAKDIITPEALNALVLSSGGLMVLMVRLVQSAAIYALSRGANTIELEDALAAIAEERSDFIRLLKPEHYPILAARHADKTLSSQPEVRDLLHNLALLEYSNDEPWCDVHPVIWPVVEERIG